MGMSFSWKQQFHMLEGWIQRIRFFQDCLTYCSQIHIASQKYEKNCFLDRNMYMLQKSQRVIAVYDGRKRGGTLYTINRAHSLDRDVRMIRI